MGFQIIGEGKGVELPCIMNAPLIAHMHIAIAATTLLLCQMAILRAPE